MNETKRVDASFLDGKEPIAVGYKIFGWDWSGYGGYSYADENGEVEDSVHTETGRLSKCGWGLHYCENPLDCMRYRDIIKWNKFALVEAYDENIKADGDDKSVCRTLLIKKVLSFDEMIEACKSYQKEANIAEATNGISYGYGISNGYGVYNSKHCRKCEGISRCLFCYGLEGAKLMLFNKPISAERFNEVLYKLGGWYPNFTNAEELKQKYGNGEWKTTPAPAIEGRTVKEAYAEMPETLIAYVKSLPEYDDEIFRKITGADDDQ